MSSNVYAWPTDGITVPCFVFGYPETIQPKVTFNRGGDEAQFPLWYILGAGQTSTKGVRDQVSAALGSMNDVITALDGDHAFGAVDTRGPKIESVNSGSITYISLRFDCYVLTSGAMNMSAIMDGLAALVTAAGL
jgi:hypothetical protein